VGTGVSKEIGVMVGLEGIGKVKVGAADGRERGEQPLVIDSIANKNKMRIPDRNRLCLKMLVLFILHPLIVTKTGIPVNPPTFLYCSIFGAAQFSLSKDGPGYSDHYGESRKP